MMLWKRVITWQKNGTLSLSRENVKWNHTAEGPLFREIRLKSRKIGQNSGFRDFGIREFVPNPFQVQKATRRRCMNLDPVIVTYDLDPRIYGI